MKRLFSNSFLRLLLSIGFASITTVSCAQQKGENKEEKVLNPKIMAVNAQKQIESLVDLTCDNSSQCKAIGFGHSPCGGHQKYLIYSEKNTNTVLFKSKVEKYNAIQKKKNIKEGVVGICVHISEPKTYCSQSKCVSSSTVNRLAH